MDVLVMVDKTEHAFFRVIFQASSDFSESGLVEVRVIFFICQDRVVTPDDFFFTNPVGEAFERVNSFV